MNASTRQRKLLELLSKEPMARRPRIESLLFSYQNWEPPRKIDDFLDGVIQAGLVKREGSGWDVWYILTDAGREFLANGKSSSSFTTPDTRHPTPESEASPA